MAFSLIVLKVQGNMGRGLLKVGELISRRWVKEGEDWERNPNLVRKVIEELEAKLVLRVWVAVLRCKERGSASIITMPPSMIKLVREDGRCNGCLHMTRVSVSDCKPDGKESFHNSSQKWKVNWEICVEVSRKFECWTEMKGLQRVRKACMWLALHYLQS